VVRIHESEGIWVQLLEYGLAQALILPSEATRARKGKRTSLSKLTRVGKREVCTVLRVDSERAFVDLSKRHVSAAEAGEAEARYGHSKRVHAIVCHVARTLSLDAKAIYAQTVWPLSKQLGCHPFEAFCAASVTPHRIFNEKLTPQLSPPLRAALLSQIRVRLAPKTTAKVCAQVQVRWASGVWSGDCDMP